MPQPIIFRLQQLRTATAGATPLVPDPRVGAMQRPLQALTLSVDVGSYALSGDSSTNYIIGAAPFGSTPIGALLSRSASGTRLLADRKLSITPGSYTVSGTATGLL